MREIKFRAWHKKRKKMYQVEELRLEGLQDGGGFAKLKNPQNQLYFTPANKIILMQFTGLLDSKGVEIYEGDIIKQGNNPECWFAPRVVEFKHGAWMGGDIRIYVEQDWVRYEGKVSNHKWEILGNIWENKELLNDNTRPVK